MHIDMLAFGPVLILVLGALLIVILGASVRSFVLGLGTIACCALSLGWLVAAQQQGASAALGWLVVDQRTLQLSVATGDSLLLGSMLLLCGAATAGTLAWSFGRGTRAVGTVYGGLLVLLAGGLLAITGVPAPAVMLGLGLAWLGGTIMQQATAASDGRAPFAGLPILALATALLGLGAAPQLEGAPIADMLWLAGCCVLIALGPIWGATPAVPLVVRAPVAALGLPALGGILLLRHGLAAAETWSEASTLALLWFGVAATMAGAWNALTATRLGDAFGWQTTAQLATLAIVFGTGRPEAGPAASGLLAHALLTATAAALAIGVLEQTTGSDVLATLPPLPQPLLAGLAYGLAGASSIGLPPLLGFSVRRVVVLLAGLSRPWLPPVLLAGSTLLALSYLPALAAFFRRPARDAPPRTVLRRGGGWPMLLMLGLVCGGLAPQILWQRALGDPAAVQAGVPPLAALLAGSLPSALLLALLIATVIWLRRGRPGVPFAGGEPLDEEPGWALPFAALRQAVRPPAALKRFAAFAVLLREQRDRLAAVHHALERRMFLAVVVLGLLAVLLLAAQ